jgi:hypothetical protein
MRARAREEAAMNTLVGLGLSYAVFLFMFMLLCKALGCDQGDKR